jgi:hypothetical protein
MMATPFPVSMRDYVICVTRAHGFQSTILMPSSRGYTAVV